MSHRPEGGAASSSKEFPGLGTEENYQSEGPREGWEKKSLRLSLQRRGRISN